MTVNAFGETWPIMKFEIQADIEVNAVPFARMPVYMISTGLSTSTLGQSSGWFDLLRPGERSDAGGEGKVEDVGHGDEGVAFALGSLVHGVLLL